MSRVEVLVATMHQKDYSLPERMNLDSDAVIINQCDTEATEVLEYRGHRILFISTKERGLSNSRNLAVSHASGDILLIADDDITYPNDYAEQVSRAFDGNPQADIIAFNIVPIHYHRAKSFPRNTCNRRAPRKRHYCSVRLAIRRSALQRTQLRFNPLFGAGAVYTTGEDTLFVRQARRKHLVIYENTYAVARVDYASSTWFQGFDEKYFFHMGAWLAAAYPSAACLLKYYYVFRLMRQSPLSPMQIRRMLIEGGRDYHVKCCHNADGGKAK